MKVLLFQLDGKIPNIALMRLAMHHRMRGDDVELRRTGKPDWTFSDMSAPRDKVYASVTFEKSRFIVDQLLREFPEAIVGGSGVDGQNGALPPYRDDMRIRLDQIGIEAGSLDYSLYPWFHQSIGFTQRGCRLKCGFCGVWRREGKVRFEATAEDVWRGGDHPRELVLLDNDFFGLDESGNSEHNWRARVKEFIDGRFKVDFNQGINARFLTDEAAEAIASLDYRACTKNRDGHYEMKVRRIYTAWDNRKDEERLFAGLRRLVKYGVKPDHIMVYMLIGYWPGETESDWLYRQKRLRDFGARPYPMPFARTTLAVWFQRWVIQAWDKGAKSVPWDEWKQAQGEPRKLTRRGTISLPLFGQTA